MWKICALLTLLLTTPSTAEHNKSNINNYGNNNTATNLRHIFTLSDRCTEQVCRNFHYANADEVAFFEIKMEVHITADSTYDLNSQKDFEILTFENSTFAHFPLHLFYALDIKELDMRNCSVAMVTWENFLMANHLRVLLLSENKLQSISEMTFIYAAELQYLFLDSNQLSTLVNESFRGLKKLKLLDLNNNRLRDLPTDLFSYMPNLQELRLHENRLFTLGNELFVHNTQLLMLMLNNNRLHSLGDYTFKPLTRLILLDISNNRPLNTFVSNLQVTQLFATNCSLSRINIYGSVQHVNLRDNRILELYFAQPENLRTLNLRNNALQQLASLTRATSLDTLIIADNPELETLPEPWLSTSLEKLDMSNTSLKAFPMQALAVQKHLRILNVSSNELREINPSNFKYLHNLTHFYIHDNDWNCFSLQMIMNMLIKPYQISYTRDSFDSDFPGEYIDGIACMYRLEQENANTNGELDDMFISAQNINENSAADLKMESIEEETVKSKEVEKLRQELDAIVGFYELKFKRAFEMIEDLKSRLTQLEQLNETFWQHITITV